MNNPLVSILIPVYNTEKYLAEAIESALNQSYKNIELIIIDDGSTDKSWEIVKGYKIKYPNIIKTYKQENKGACAARNKAFELSTGQYIQYLDADDLLAPDKIEHQIKYFDGSGNEDFVLNGKWARFYSDNYQTEQLNWGPDISIQKDLNPLDWILAHKMSTISCWLSPRNLIRLNGQWDEELFRNQDGDFFTRLVSKSKKVIFCSDSKIYYRSNIENSISSKVYNDLSIKSTFKWIQSFEKTILTLERSDRIYNKISNYYKDFVYRYYPKNKNLMNIALNKIKAYGDSDLYNNGRKITRISIKLFGWKFTLWLRYLLKLKFIRE